MPLRDLAKIDMTNYVIGIDRHLDALPVADSTGHDSAIDGLVFGVALMTENAPHGGERHPDGDEVLHLASGRATVVFTDDPLPDVELEAGDTVIVPRGLWHRVDILEPSRIVYLTPGQNNEVRPAP